MNAFVSRGLITLAVTGGLVVLGAGAAHADDGTDGDGGLLSGLQGIVNIDLPVTISGNGISVGGSSSSSGAASTPAAGTSAPGGSTSGSDSLLGGTQGLIGVNVPITVSGNAVSVLGDSSSEDSSFEGANGSGDAGSATTSGKDGILGGSQVVGGVNTPVTVSGNAISVLGDSSSSGSATSAGATGSGSSAPSGSTTGTDSVLGGTQVLADAAAPVTVGGNAISVLGDSTSSGAAVTGGTSGEGSGSTGTTTGGDSILGGTQVLGDVAAPAVVGGNAISVIGDSESNGALVTGGTGSGGAGEPATTDGSDGVASGSQVVADVVSPITAGGNAISVVGDSTSTGAVVSSPETGGSVDGVTTGGDGVLGGTQVLLGGDVPITLGGNAISVIGDSTTTGGGQDGEVGGETTTPPTTGGPGDPGVLGTSALQVSALAATGSALLTPALAFALLLMAAGSIFLARARVARR
jgi:hypothetical protein